MYLFENSLPPIAKKGHDTVYKYFYNNYTRTFINELIF